MKPSIQPPIYTLKDLEMPDDEPMVIIRSSLLWICDGDKYAAAALNMYVHWTRWIMKHKPVAQKINQMLKKQGKTATQNTGLILYRKQTELVEDLLHFCNEKRLRQANAFLVSKELLKIEDMPRHMADHVLKYELQIGKFKELMNDWRKYREENHFSGEDEMIEVALDEDSDRTDNSPLRSRQLSDDSRSRNGQFTDPNGQLSAPKVIDDKKEIVIDKRNSSSTRNHNVPSLSESTQMNPSSQQNAEESNPVSPTAEETRRKTLNACLESEKVTQVFTEDEQVVWDIVCQARQLQAKRLGIALKAWKVPTNEQREHISQIAVTIAEHKAPVSKITPEWVELEWLKVAEAKGFHDMEWKMKNLANEFSRMLATGYQEAPQPDMLELTVEESEQEVLWASKPSTIERLFAQQATMEVHMSTLGKNLRMMPRSEAREFGYDQPNVQHYTPEQVEWFRQKTATRELVTIAG